MATTDETNTTAVSPTHANTFLHKTVSQTSKNKNNWVSPFRPASTTTVATPKKEEVKAEADNAPEETVEEPLEEPLEEPVVEEPVVEDEEPLQVATETEEGDVDATEEEPIVAFHENDAPETEEPVAETTEEEPAASAPAASESAPVKKSAPIKPAVLEIPATIRSHPKMLRRYKENFNIASQIMNKNRIENVDRRVDLGAGLILTEDQIYELARKKLQPLMNQIDERVAENNARDAEKAAKVEADIKARDEGVVAGMLAKYKAEVDAKIKVSTAEHEKKFKELEDKSAQSKADYEEYLKVEKDGIVKDQEDAEKSEEDAKTGHDENKETLIATHEKHKEDKTNELETFKTKQIEESELIEKFTADTEAMKAKQSDLSSTLEAKKAELEEKIKKVEALIAAKHEKKETIRSSLKRKNVAERSFGIIDSTFAQAAANVALLSTHVGKLGDRVNAHSTKIEHYNTTAKEALSNKKVEAEKAAQEWQEHLAQVRLEEAQKQEQIRIAAEEERKRIEQEKADEEARIAKEKEEEEARIAKEKEEEEARIAKQKEEDRIAAEKKRQEEEEAAEIAAADVERLKELKRLNDEKIQIKKDLEEQNRALAEAAQKAKVEAERKEAEEKAKIDAQKKAAEAKDQSSSGGILGAAAGILTGAAVAGAATAGAVASTAANATSNIVGASGNALNAAATPAGTQAKAVETPLSGGNALSSTNPFYVGDFNDQKDDLPSIIHEEEEHQEPVVHAKEELPEEDPLHEVETITVGKENEKEVESVEPAAAAAAATDDEVTTPPSEAAPINRRRSMVDEALAHMTPEQIAKMNTPLSQLVTKQASKNSATDAKVTPASTSRSNSLTSKFSLMRTKSKSGGSRNNSLKGENPKIKSNSGSNRAQVSNPKPPVISAPIPIEKSAAPVANASPAAAASVMSIAPSGISQAEISEAKAVQIKNSGDEHADLYQPEKTDKTEATTPEATTPVIDEPVVATAEHAAPATATTTATATAGEEDDDSELDLDSDLNRSNVNPVFTEKIGTAEETAPTTALSEGNTNPESDYVEVSTLETVSSSEYFNHKDDPNYMVVQD